MGDTATSKIPAGVNRIEAAGQYLIPALNDMHVHLEGDAWNAMFPPEQRFPPESLALKSCFSPMLRTELQPSR